MKLPIEHVHEHVLTEHSINLAIRAFMVQGENSPDIHILPDDNTITLEFVQGCINNVTDTNFEYLDNNLYTMTGIDISRVCLRIRGHLNKYLTVIKISTDATFTLSEVYNILPTNINPEEKFIYLIDKSQSEKPMYNISEQMKDLSERMEYLSSAPFAINVLFYPLCVKFTKNAIVKQTPLILNKNTFKRESFGDTIDKVVSVTLVRNDRVRQLEKSLKEITRQ